MRPFSPQFLGRYLAAAGPHAHQSVGAYQLDGLGIQLFDRIAYSDAKRTLIPIQAGH
jgi:septum formation protein